MHSFFFLCTLYLYIIYSHSSVNHCCCFFILHSKKARVYKYILYLIRTCSYFFFLAKMLGEGEPRLKITSRKSCIVDEKVVRETRGSIFIDTTHSYKLLAYKNICETFCQKLSSLVKIFLQSDKNLRQRTRTHVNRKYCSQIQLGFYFSLYQICHKIYSQLSESSFYILSMRFMRIVIFFFYQF